MNPSDIYLALRQKKLNASIVAEAIEVTPQNVGQVIRSGKGSKRIAKSIAVALDMPLEKVFPYYSQNKIAKDQRSKAGEELRKKIRGVI